ncbi:unnamed protein product, partial [Urochloa humidicola]
AVLPSPEFPIHLPSASGARQAPDLPACLHRHAAVHAHSAGRRLPSPLRWPLLPPSHPRPLLQPAAAPAALAPGAAAAPTAQRSGPAAPGRPPNAAEQTNPTLSWRVLLKEQEKECLHALQLKMQAWTKAHSERKRPHEDVLDFP